MKKNRWVHMPHPGHFIGGPDCRFHLNTYVGKYIVSTGGEYTPGGTDISREIGYGRKYETMVFKAFKSQAKCCPYRQADGSSLDFVGYTTAETAFLGHVKLCHKWSKK
jgi:hypothetical protein